MNTLLLNNVMLKIFRCFTFKLKSYRMEMIGKRPIFKLLKFHVLRMATSLHALNCDNEIQTVKLIFKEIESLF